MASTTSQTGSDIDRDIRIMIGNPKTTAASETTSTGIPTGAVFNDPAAGLNDDDYRDHPEGQPTGQQPHDDEAREHPGGRHALPRSCGGGDYHGTKGSLGEQKARSGRRACADCDAQQARHCETQAAIAI